MIMKNQKDFLKAFANAAEEKFDFREGEMATPEFMEWMRDQFAAYDEAIEKDVRAMSRDDFKSKWLDRRMYALECINHPTAEEDFREENAKHEAIADTIRQMLDDFDYITD